MRFKIILTHIYVLFVASLPLGFIACGGGGSDSYLSSPPNLTGEWTGTFVSKENANSFEINFEISTQKGENFEGAWISSSIVNITSGSVDGFVYPGNDARWLVSLTLSRESVTCCVPLLGCSDRPLESLVMLGYFEKESVVDEEAYHGFSCSGETGTLIISRQP